MAPPSPSSPDRRPAARNTVRLVRDQLSDNPAWRFYARNGKWICPYCLALIARRAGKSMPDSILLHLESCRTWARGKGKPQADTEILKRARFEDLVCSIDGDPATWCITDHMGVWFCPSCQERIPSVRMAAGQPLSSFVYQAVSDHLARCPLWQDDYLPSPGQVETARSRAACMPQLMAFAQERLQHPLWRFTDPSGLWICPYCLGHVPMVRSASVTEWARASEGIAQHLLCRCTAYAANPAVTRDEAQVAQAATTTGLPTPSAGTPSTRSRTTTEIMTAPTRTMPVAQPMTRIGSRRLSPPQRTPSSVQTMPPAMPASALTPARPSPILPESAAPPPAAPPSPPPPPVVEADAQPLDWMDNAEDVGATSAKPPPEERSDVLLARDVQQNLLQPPPDLPGLRFAVRFEPCTDISGDFYEFISFADGRVGFAIGDVSGHGMQAGLIMSMAKKAFEIYASIGASPAETLAKVNNSLLRELAGKMFVSMVYGLLDPESRTITWARAGHNPPLRLTRDGVMHEIKPPGMVVGMKEGTVYQRALKEEVTPLESGDMVLIYTDGITEAMNMQQEEFGEERLQEVMRRYAGEGPDVLVDRIMDLVRHFRGPQSRADDLTLLALAVD